MIDTHLHTKFSVDGKHSLEEMVQAAIAKGLSLVCFTEHFDLNRHDPGYGYFREAAYSDEIKRVQDAYAGQITVLKGIEFSEPHQYPRELEAFQRKDYDFILGSVHWVNDRWLGEPAYRAAHPVERLFELHYEQTLLACRQGGFDALAHIDFPRRYLKEESFEPWALLDEILKEVVARDISLELNTMPLRKKLREIHPSANIRARYAALGGVFYTTGSDGHNVYDLAAGLDTLPELGLRQCYYQARRRVEV